MEVVLLLQNGEGRKSQQDKIRERVSESGFEFAVLELDKGVTEEEPDDMGFIKQIEEWITENKKPVATLRWDEHGNVFGKHPKFKKIATWGWENKIAPLNIDFGYFCHYGSFMFDLLDRNGNTSVKREWASLDKDLMPMEEFPGKLGDFIRLVKRIYEKHEYFYSMKHFTASYRYVVFTQCLANNCKVMRSNDASAWIHNMNLALGSSALFKIQPAMFNDKKIDLTGFRTVFSGGFPDIINQSIEQNACLAVPAEACITNTSAVTSELLIGGKQIITTGESWFSGLGVFHEVDKWDNLEPTVEQCAGKAVSGKQFEARLKFVNWWRKHQAMHGEKSLIVKDLINYFKQEN